MYSTGTPSLHAAHIAIEMRRVVRHGRVGRGGIQWIAPGHHFEQRSRILHIAGERADVIERTGERHQAIARNTPVGRRYADHATERSRLADRAAGIGAERNHGCVLRHHRCRSAARSAGNPIERHGIAHRPERAVLVRRSHGEFIAIGLADDDSAGGFNPLDCRGVVGRDVMLQHADPQVVAHLL